MRFPAFGALCALLAWALAAAAVAGDLQVRDARVRLLPGEVPAAGYFRLENSGKQPIVLVAAESPAFAHIMLHRTTQARGMIHMEHAASLRIDPGQTLEFAPGGYHLMLMQPRRSLAIGDEITITLVFASGQRLPVPFRAVSPTAP